MATRFKEVMDAHHISIHQLAELTGDTETNIRTLRSRDISTTSILIKYARAMNVPIWEMFVKPEKIITYSENLYENFDDMLIAKRISEELKKRNMSQLQLANAMGKHATFIGRILNDGNITIITLESICRALGMEIWEMFASREEFKYNSDTREEQTIDNIFDMVEDGNQNASTSPTDTPRADSDLATHIAEAMEGWLRSRLGDKESYTFTLGGMEVTVRQGGA